MDCSNWMDRDFTYPDQVTDVIIFYQCSDGQGETLRKVKSVKQECCHCIIVYPFVALML